MRTSATLLLLFATVLAAQPKGKQKKRDLPPREAVRRTFQTGAEERVYYFAKAEANPAAPVVLVFHQGGTSAEALAESSRLMQVPAMRRMALVFPGASSNGKWNEGDIEFVRGLVAGLLKEDPSLDRTRVFATGLNEGGAFAHRLGCEMSGALAGIASLGGWLLKAQRETCKPSMGLPVFMVDTAEDGELLPNVGETFERWRALNGCSGDVTLEAIAQPVPHKVLTARPCKDGSEVRHLRASKVAPAWQNAVAREMATFFMRFRRMPKI